MTFLKNIATQVWNQYQDNISDHLFLFPSRRSMLYFKRALTETAARNLWVPECLTLEKWILDQSRFLVTDPITSSYHLYRAAREVNFIDYSFESFYPLSQVILRDFEEVDMALIDIDEFWAQTSAWQNISGSDHPSRIWEEMNDTPLKVRWEINWNKLRKLYGRFGTRLQALELSTKGRIYRETAEQLIEHPPLKHPQIHIIGFSSLCRAEVRVMEHFKSQYSVSFYWNEMPHWDMPGLDAGKNIQKWGEYFGQDLMDNSFQPPEVQVISAPGMVSQLKMASQLLDKAEGPEDHMAVVLPHPSLIDLFLESFPDSRSKVNISMGYPLVYSPVRSLIDWILTLWEKLAENEGKIKKSDLELVWSHVYITNYSLSEAMKLPDSPQLYFDADDLVIEQPLSQLLFAPLSSPAEALGRLIGIVSEIITAQNDLFHREILRFVSGRLVRLDDVLSGIDGITLIFLKRILIEMMQGAAIPFRGEPMQGVQVLGVQEVQNLAFDTLIIPGLNEEILPSGKIKSLIPFSLRGYYGLTDQGDQHAIQSYYLWSALLQARKVFLIHSQVDDFLGAKGRSRYLFQLQYGGLDIPVAERYLDLELSGFEPGIKEVFLTTGYSDRLTEYLQKEGLSPTALISYVTCPFLFFLKYILRIREDDIPADGLDHRQMGTVIHDVMHDLYAPWIGKEMDHKDFDSIATSIERVARSSYMKLYPNDSPEMMEHGIHWVEQEIVIRAVRRIAEVDRRITGLRIEILEDDRELYIDTGRIKNVRLRGKIDRLDQKGGVYRVIDYKTGTSHLKSKTISELWNDSDPVHNWQLLFYAYLMKEKMGTDSFEMGHYTLKSKQLFAQMKTGRRTTFGESDLLEFEEVLVKIIDSMVDPDIPFSQTTDTDRCQYCVFNTYCERQAHR